MKGSSGGKFWRYSELSGQYANLALLTNKTIFPKWLHLLCHFGTVYFGTVHFGAQVCTYNLLELNDNWHYYEPAPALSPPEAEEDKVRGKVEREGPVGD